MVALGRRFFVRGGEALGTTALWPAWSSRAATAMGFDEARHLLSRATFGATPKKSCVTFMLMRAADCRCF